MAWTTPPTWGVQPWEFTDAATYIAGNSNHLRNMMVAEKCFSYPNRTVTDTTSTIFTTAANAITPTPPDEDFFLYAMMQFWINADSGSQNHGFTCDLLAEPFTGTEYMNGPEIFKFGAHNPPWPFDRAASTGMMQGIWRYAAGSDPGVSMQATKVTSSSYTMDISLLTWVCW